MQIILLDDPQWHMSDEDRSRLISGLEDRGHDVVAMDCRALDTPITDPAMIREEYVESCRQLLHRYDGAIITVNDWTKTTAFILAGFFLSRQCPV
ncbi:MAG: hypothetical protein GDA50_07885 [Alphaproteobacteria bacterium GM202ARS2]|nr:hypothetical protein [Alphaproteobacteria bacterium GM202ARS2]